MKRVCTILTVVLVMLQLCSDNIWARPTTRQEAEKVVKGWLKASPRPLGAALGWQVTKIETYTDDGGNPLFIDAVLKRHYKPIRSQILPDHHGGPLGIV